MSNALVFTMTFTMMALAGLLLFKPVITKYIDTYQVRVRPRKDGELTSAEKPRQSAILATFSAYGHLILSAFPTLADKRSVALLTMANYRTPEHLAILTGVKAVAATFVVMLGLVAAASNPINLVLTVPAVILAWMIPNFFLAKRVSQRQANILRELPIIIDLLIVCAQAGLGLLMAVEKISREVDDTCPTLASELKQMINDVKMFAKSVPISLREMGERCGVDELINLAAALIAAEAKGADISYPLRQQGEALRDRIKRKREEEAGKVPVKMVPVIMIFIMPLILAPMLGPAVVVILEVAGPILKGMK